MGYWGKIIGGTAGFFVGGPYGAVIGAALGHAADTGSVDSIRRPFMQSAPINPAHVAGMLGRREEVFAVTVTVLAAKLAKCDGPVTRLEIDAFKRNFRIPPASARGIGRLFDQARDSSDPAEPYAAQLAEAFADHRGVLDQVLTSLFNIARADGPLTVREQDFLRRVHRRLGLDQLSWDRAFGEARRRPVRVDDDDPYIELGLTRAASGEELRATWKRLMLGESPRQPRIPRRAGGFHRPRQRQGGSHQCRVGPHQAGTRAMRHRQIPVLAAGGAGAGFRAPRPADHRVAQPEPRRTQRNGGYAHPALHRDENRRARQSIGCAIRPPRCPPITSSTRTARSSGWCPRTGAPGMPGFPTGGATRP